MTKKQAYDWIYSQLRKNEQSFEERQRRLVMGRQMDYAEYIEQCRDNMGFSRLYRAACVTWLANRGASSITPNAR